MTRGAALLPARLARERSRQRLRYPVSSRASRTRWGPRSAVPTPRWSSLAASRWPGRRARTGWGRTGRPSRDRRRRSDGERPAATAGRRAACGDHQPVRIRDEGIDHLHLHADDRMEPSLLGGCGETDDPVEAPTIGDGERREAQLDGTRREVRRGGGAVEEGEVGVRVELGIGRRGHGANPGAWRDGGTAVAAAGVSNDRTDVLFSQSKSACNKSRAILVTEAMSTLAAGTRSLLPRILLLLLAGVLVLVVLPAVLAIAGGTAT